MPVDPTTERLVAAITWEWRDVEDLIEELIPTVAPGRALRKYQQIAKPNKGTGTRPPLTEDEQITSGARAIINNRLWSQQESGRVEVETNEETGARRVRFRERVEIADDRGCCPACNRPFVQATEGPLPSPKPKPRPKILYPTFPKWDRTLDEGSNG